MTRSKVLITGGAGFIGSHIAALASQHADVRILDNFRSGFRENLRGIPHELIEGSIEDVAALKSAMEGIDYVFHLAAMISVPESMMKPQECVAVNTLGTLNVLEAAAQAGVNKLVYHRRRRFTGMTQRFQRWNHYPHAPRVPMQLQSLMANTTALCIRRWAG